MVTFSSRNAVTADLFEGAHQLGSYHIHPERGVLLIGLQSPDSQRLKALMGRRKRKSTKS